MQVHIQNDGPVTISLETPPSKPAPQNKVSSCWYHRLFLGMCISLSPRCVIVFIIIIIIVVVVTRDRLTFYISRPPPPPHQTWRLFETKILTSTASYITFWVADLFNETCVAFCHKTKFQGYSKMWLFLGTLIWSVHLCSQSSISRANGDRRSQIEKRLVVSAFSATGGRGCGET